MDTRHALAPGTELRSPSCIYTIQSVLGRGGFGITYSATYIAIEHGEPVMVFAAVKEHFISSLSQRDPDTGTVITSEPAAGKVNASLHDFISEARRLKSLSGQNHNIVNVREVFEANGTAYYAMEHLGTLNLRDYIAARGPLTVEQAYVLLRPIIEAVGMLHTNRITHLDIKPANIMIATDDDATQRPVLIDFGLSKHYNLDGSGTSVINSRGYSDGYSSIEQYAGIDTFSPSSDVYSLAAVLIFCLTGKTPPRATDLSCDGDIEALLPGSVKTKERKAIIKAMQPGRQKRTPDANALLETLDKAGNTTHHRHFNLKRTLSYTLPLIVVLIAAAAIYARCTAHSGSVIATAYSNTLTTTMLLDDDNNAVVCRQNYPYLIPVALGTYAGDKNSCTLNMRYSTGGNRHMSQFSKQTSYAGNMSANGESASISLHISNSTGKPHDNLADMFDDHARFMHTDDYYLSKALIGSRWQLQGDNSDTGDMYFDFVSPYYLKVTIADNSEFFNYLCLENGRLAISTDTKDYLCGTITDFDQGATMHLRFNDKGDPIAFSRIN